MSKMKFKMSMKELSFEFEGDVETGQRMQAGLQKTLGVLAQQPNRLLPGFVDEAITVEAKPVEQNGSNGNGNGKKRTRRTRVKGQGARALIAGLKGEGFFEQKRDIAAIRVALSNKGFNFGSNELSAALTPLVQKGVLIREKGDGTNFEYEKGPNDDDAGSPEDAE